MPPVSKSDAAGTAAKPAAVSEGAAEGSSRPSAPRGGTAAWLPAVAALVLAPAGTWATVEFVLLPRLQAKIAALATAPVPTAGVQGEKGPDGRAKESATAYEFQNVVVNLAGTAGTRYLKTSFMVTGADAALRATFEGAKPRLMDVTLNVLSSLTLADLEEPGARNIIREKLVVAYNQVLGRKVADQVYFSDFVVQ